MHGCAHFTEPRDEPREDVAAPRPLSNGRKAALVDIDHRDAAAVLRRRRQLPKKSVVGATIEIGEERRPPDRDCDRQQRRGHPAEQHQPPAGDTRVRRLFQGTGLQITSTILPLPGGNEEALPRSKGESTPHCSWRASARASAAGMRRS